MVTDEPVATAFRDINPYQMPIKEQDVKENTTWRRRKGDSNADRSQKIKSNENTESKSKHCMGETNTVPFCTLHHKAYLNAQKQIRIPLIVYSWTLKKTLIVYV